MQAHRTEVVTPRAPRPKHRIFAGVAVILLLAAAGAAPRWSRHQRAMTVARAAETELPLVNVAQARTAPPQTELILPGNTEAVATARVYARADGYVRRRFVDIGSRVKAGQLLATIESPEVDQQLAEARATADQSRAALEQARATLQQARAAVVQARSNLEAARANEEIAATTHQRWDRLVAKGVLPRQSGDERRSAFAARTAETAAAAAAQRTAEASVLAEEAHVKASQAAANAQAANVRRLEQIQGFQRVVAPFDGVITERKIEQGDLVTAGGGAVNLFSIAQAQTLRIQVDVPQAHAMSVQPGQQAEVIVRDLGGKRFVGAVARTAGALNDSSRTLRAEVQVDNRNGDLLPGMYAEVKFELTRAQPAVLIPSDTLVVNAQGARVFTLSPDGKVRAVSVRLGRDLGAAMEVIDGLAGGERLVSSPPDTLHDGQQVRVAAPEGKRS
jgi:RND family efflux transporter MFP subunit